MTPEERLTRIEKALDKHIEFVGSSIVGLNDVFRLLAQQVNRTAAAQEITEERLQALIEQVARHESDRIRCHDRGRSSHVAGRADGAAQIR